MKIIESDLLSVIAKQQHKNNLMGSPSKYVSIQQVIDGMGMWFGVYVNYGQVLRKCKKLFDEDKIGRIKRGSKIYFYNI